MNITAEATQFVLNALAAMLEGKKVFTAHDVKVAAREKTNTDGTNEKIYHDDVREIVHNEFNIGEFPDEYNKEEFLALTNGHTAICYYPDGKTAEDHPMAVQGQSAAAQPTSSPISSLIDNATTAAPKPKQGGSVKDGNGFICSETSKGVINIPGEIVKDMTLTGGTYDIQINAGGEMIYKAPDGKGRLRIASSKLGTGSKFRLEIIANTITVEQV